MCPSRAPCIPEFADGPDGVGPAAADPIDRQHHQGAAADQAAVEPTSPAVPGAGGVGDADVPVDVVPLTPDLRSRISWLKGYIPATPSLQVAAGPDVSEEGHAAISRLIRSCHNRKMMPAGVGIKRGVPPPRVSLIC